MPEVVPIASLVLMVTQVGILTGVFYRLGRIGRAIEDHDRRLTDIEKGV